MTTEAATGTEITQPGEAEKVEEQKPTEAAKPAEPAAEKKAEEAPKPEVKKTPEKYELKLPEGSKLDAKHLEKIEAEAKARGLSNEDAQALVNRDNQLLADYNQKQEVQLKETTAQWFLQSKEDKELGGENFAQNAELAKRVVTKFGTEAFQKALESTGFANHPELFRVFYRIGKAMKDDQLVIPGAQSGAQEKTIAEKLYGKTS